MPAARVRGGGQRPLHSARDDERHGEDLERHLVLARQASPEVARDGEDQTEDRHAGRRDVRLGARRIPKREQTHRSEHRRPGCDKRAPPGP